MLFGRSILSFLNGRFTRFGLGSGLTVDWVNYAIESVNSGLWVATGDGLNHRRDGVWTAYNGLSDDYVRALALDDLGRVWIGTTSGLDVFENGKLRQVPTPGGELQHKIRAIACGRNQSLWLGTDAGVLRRADGEWTFLTATNGLTDQRVCALSSDRDGNIWIGTRGDGSTR